MIGLVTKEMLFRLLDTQVDVPGSIGFKEIQLAGVAAFLSSLTMSRVGEVTDADPQIDRILSDDNEFYVIIPGAAESAGVVHVLDRGRSDAVGERDARGSVSVLVSMGHLDRVGNGDLLATMEQMLALVAPSGLMVHATSHYLEDRPSPYWTERIRLFRSFPEGRPCELLAGGDENRLGISSVLASLSDLDMYKLYRESGSMRDLRKDAQGVGLVVMYRKAD
jgi:hypothetical protein